MRYQGVLKKMKTEIQGQVQYYLDMDTDFLIMNQLIGKSLKMAFEKYECLNCHLEKEIYRQGFCKSCFFETPSAGDWIMRPELSKAHLGIEDRDLAFEQEMQLKPHVVYLANSSNVKVGVTRKSQVPTRWIDQGAHEAVPIVEVPNRYLAGITEVALKDHVADKTNWRKMLKGENEDIDLLEKRKELAAFIPDEVKEYYDEVHAELFQIDFPVSEAPEKVKSLNLIKTPEYTGTLKGVKGQYLIFEDDTVFNVRANEGLVISIEVL